MATRHAAKHRSTASRTANLPSLSMRAEVAPNSLDEDKRTVDVVWTTGARVRRGFFEQYDEELDLSPKAVRMGRLQSGNAPLLNAHNSYDLGSVIGVIAGASLQATRGVATIRFGRGADDDAIFSKVKDGILRNVSVGYRVYKMVKVEDGDGTVPVYRAVDWEPYEISIVPMPADAGSVVRAGAAETNSCEFVQERHMKKKKAAVDEKAETRAECECHSRDDGSDCETCCDDCDCEGRAAHVDGDEKRAIEEAARVGERKRIAAIERVGATLSVSAETVKKHIADGTSEEKFRAIAVEDFGKTTRVETGTGGGAITAGPSDRDKYLRQAEDWLLVRAGVDGDVALAAKKGIKGLKGMDREIDPGECRGLSLFELARDCLDRAGVKTRGMARQEIIGKALTHRAGGLNTTSDFPIILENVLYKTLLGSYGITADTWTTFCATGSVADFRPNKRYRLGSFGPLQSLNEHGEFKNQQIPDAYRESISAATKGNMIGISRQSIINDDMGAFTSLATMLGRAARLSIEADVYATLALNAGLGPLMGDGLTLFHATHGNIGTGAALSVASIDADRILMAAQKDPSGNDILDLKPSLLLIASGLGGAARVINNSQYDVDPVTTNATNFFQKPNKVVGLYQSVVDTARLTGTRRYSFASMSVVPVIEVVFLDGQREPFMEIQNGWRVDGVEWKVRLDYGVGAVDFRGAVTNAGV